ncbi:hypothetical protein [Lysobacter enzymogenes]|uniref:hypothetical protein n=1 Tax=Lysobacter enzymogenes TaxID=69 RepID=UPI001AF402DD|nr:hypothetical protein [Lysobacter enzymogenes]QQQ02487.1 hypothetical protein JHW41_05760 [Lysobacter enzymogenes]
MFKSRLLTPVLLATVTAISALLPISSAFAACNDCPWLFVRCMSRADTPEKEQACEESRQLCEETFCNNPRAARLSASPAIVENPLPQARDLADRRPQARRSAQ